MSATATLLERPSSISTSPAPLDTAQIVQQLNAGWRNYICDAMKLDRNTFQLAQGSLGLQTTDSSGLYLMADAVPPATTVGYYDSTSMDRRSSAYSELLSALLPETNPNALQNALGDYYSTWTAWNADTKDNPIVVGETYLARFKRWEASSSIDPGRGARAEAAIIAASNTPLNLAWGAYTNPAGQQTFVNSAGSSYQLYTYTATIANAQAALPLGGGPLTINFDSSNMDTSSSSFFADGSASGFYSIFSGSAGGSFDQQNSKAAGSGMTIKGTISQYATLSSGPGSWYTSGEVSRAYNANGNALIWDPGASAGNWSSFFGQPDGSLARYVSQIVLVSGYTLTVTSEATYTQNDFQQIKGNASVGVWPFFSASASSTQTTSYALNSDSTLSVTQSLGAGLIQIWGVTVQAAP